MAFFTAGFGSMGPWHENGLQMPLNRIVMVRPRLDYVLICDSLPSSQLVNP